MRAEAGRSAAVLVLCALLSAGLGADYQAGFEAYRRGDYRVAMREWEEVAGVDPGTAHPATVAEACYGIGMLYWIGQGVPADPAMAADWLRRAAELDHAGAQAKLGFLYLQGQGVERSDFEAFKWLQMAAAKGDVDAQYNLAVMHRDGLGVPADAQKALHWFRQAAAAGDAVSADMVAAYERDGRFPAGPADSVAQAGEAAPELDPAGVSSDLAATPVATTDPDGRSSEDWIRARNPEHYTIQVIALRQPEKLWDFIEAHPDWQPFAIYRPKGYVAPLWVLVQGEYAAAESAHAARVEFPAGLERSENMWVRKFGKVQELLE